MIDELKEKLSVFLAANANSSLDAMPTEVSSSSDTEAKMYVVRDPWGDKTLLITLPVDAAELEKLVEVLNSVELPKRFSAIFHKDTSTLEVIWTAYKLSNISLDVASREFVFNFMGKDRQCRFGPSSEQLLIIAKNCVPCAMATATDHRNILSLHFLAVGTRLANLERAMSFFVDCGELNDDGMLNLVRHLNAFMSYYDHRTPRILIHEDVQAEVLSPRERYLNGSFPGNINGRELDANILAYWLEMIASRNEIMRFLLCYRIIEYAAFNYIEPAMRTKIKRLVMAPDAINDLDKLVSAIAEVSAIAKGAEDIPRAQNLIGNAVNLELIWSEIRRCNGYFENVTKFEGGFEVKALIAKADTFETWSNNGVRNTLDRLRGIRNALAHGQDTQTRATILPSAENARKIRPWLNLIEIIAGETMLYRDVV